MVGSRFLVSLLQMLAKGIIQKNCKGKKGGATAALKDIF
jgi:hypothetical protein